MNTLNITLADLKDFSDELLFGAIIDSDSYKVSHHRGYPPGTQYVYSYLESRGGMFDQQVMYGLQYILKRFIAGAVITQEQIAIAKTMIVPHMGGDPSMFNEAGWQYIVDRHHGRLPLEIRAIPEGTVITPHNALVAVVNTDPNCAWLVNYMETTLMRVWYPITVASLSYNLRGVILEYLEKTGTPEHIHFKLQDFGSRGSTSRESAAIGASAHATIFKGSDTMVAMPLLYKYYGATDMPIYSVPATEHSVITSWGRARETQAYKNFMEQFPTGIVSLVSDSYDIFNACGEIYGRELKELIMSRDGVLVVRPDSGEIIPTVLKILNILADRFGYETNSKGYKVLPSFVRVLQGDGMNMHTVRSLCRALADAGWSIDNIACFGMGGKLLQGVDRDTLKFAFKCSAVKIDNVWHEVYKEPVGDSSKTSKRGIHSVKNITGVYVTTSKLNMDHEYGDQLLPVFRDGEMICEYTINQIRETARP